MLFLNFDADVKVRKMMYEDLLVHSRIWRGIRIDLNALQIEANAQRIEEQMKKIENDNAALGENLNVPSIDTGTSAIVEISGDGEPLYYIAADTSPNCTMGHAPAERDYVLQDDSTVEMKRIPVGVEIAKD